MYNKNLKAMLLKFYFIVSFCSFTHSFTSNLQFDNFLTTMSIYSHKREIS